MTCPNCGATMERSAFMYLCSYCGSIVDPEDDDEVVDDEILSTSHVPNEENNAIFYKYVKANLQNIYQSPFVDIKDAGTVFECISSKPFSPNDGHYTLYRELALWWYANISPNGIKIFLLATTSFNAARNYICFKDIIDKHVFQQKGEVLNRKSFPVKIGDFNYICRTSSLKMDTNMFPTKCSVDYGEFVTYTHRFYNIVFDKSKYQYSIYVKLLTD